MNGEHDNAIAGPSNIRATYSGSPTPAGLTDLTAHSHTVMHTSNASPLFPLLYFPPPAPPPPRQHLASTQDLVLRLHLLPAYDKYVRPPQASLDGPLDVKTGFDVGVNANTQSAGIAPRPMPPNIDKGKGREVPVQEVDMHDPNDVDDDDIGGKGEKKKRNGYKHLIRGIPGKHSTKKDDYLENMMLVPPKQRIRIRRFDERTQEEAFSVTLEGLKGWNVNTLIVESTQAREDRKKRKEAKKAAKLQSQLIQQTGKPVPPISSSTSTHIAQPQPLPAAARSAGTPKPGVGTPRPGSTSAGPKQMIRGSSLLRPNSAAPASATPIQEQAGTPAILRKGTPMEVDQYRGKKREREEGPLVVNGAHVSVNGGAIPITTNGYANGGANGVSNTNGLAQQRQTAIALNAKAGTGNVRPRPIKKQRVDMTGQARDVTAPVQQQPTPQGV